MGNLAELAEDIEIDPVQHVPGTQNPPDIPTRATTTPYEVREGGVWQDGPAFLRLSRDLWPFSRQFLDTLPNNELHFT